MDTLIDRWLVRQLRGWIGGCEHHHTSQQEEEQQGRTSDWSKVRVATQRKAKPRQGSSV